jgi:hypothetical protein
MKPKKCKIFNTIEVRKGVFFTLYNAKYSVKDIAKKLGINIVEDKVPADHNTLMFIRSHGGIFTKQEFRVVITGKKMLIGRYSDKYDSNYSVPHTEARIIYLIAVSIVLWIYFYDSLLAGQTLGLTTRKQEECYDFAKLMAGNIILGLNNPFPNETKKM